MVIFKKKTVFHGHLRTFCVEGILIENDVSAVCVKITPASYVKQDLAVAYRIVLDYCRFRETVWPQSHLFTTAVVSLIQIDVENSTIFKFLKLFTQLSI